METVGPFNKQECEDRVYSKIDRVFVYDVWENNFPQVVVDFLPKSVSDTPPILFISRLHRVQNLGPSDYMICGLVLNNLRALLQELDICR